MNFCKFCADGWKGRHGLVMVINAATHLTREDDFLKKLLRKFLPEQSFFDYVYQALVLRRRQ